MGSVRFATVFFRKLDAHVPDQPRLSCVTESLRCNGHGLCEKPHREPIFGQAVVVRRLQDVLLRLRLASWRRCWPQELLPGRATTRRALAALKNASANPAGAGPGAMMDFRGHVITIVSATRNPGVRKLGDELVSCAEELFAGRRSKLESHCRKRLFAAHQELSPRNAGPHQLAALAFTFIL